MLTELHTYDEEASQLQQRLQEIPADIESQRLSAALTEIYTRLTTLLSQAQQGRTILEEAQKDQGKRRQDIHTYQIFLDETDAWLKDTVSKLHEQHSINVTKVS